MSEISPSDVDGCVHRMQKLGEASIAAQESATAVYVNLIRNRIALLSEINPTLDPSLSEDERRSLEIQINGWRKDQHQLLNEFRAEALVSIRLELAAAIRDVEKARWAR